MSYIRCTKCDYSQDDFYHEGYNPAKYLMDWNESLISDEIDKLFPGDSQWIKENGNITYREVIARNYEEFARRIREMKWTTRESYVNDPIKECPKCHNKNCFVED